MELLPPLHARVRMNLQQMLSGMPTGTKLAAERDLSSRFGVGRVTIRRALQDLAREGVLEIRHGSGAYLMRQIEAPADAAERPRFTSTIGLSVPPVVNRFISRIAVGVEEEASAHGYCVVLSHNRNNVDMQIKQLQMLMQRGCSGVIAFPEGENVNRPEYVKTVRRLIGSGTPVVLLDRYVPGSDAPSVVTDAFKGSYEATEHLIIGGRRRLALLRFGSGGGASDTERNRGFRAALQDYGLDPTPVREAEVGVAGHETKAREVVTRWWTEKPECFDGIVAMEDNMAFGAYLGLRDLGVRVPQDVAMIGFDNLDAPEYRDAGLRLSSIDQPAEEMGRQAARLLLTLLGTQTIPAGSEPRRSKHVMLPPHLVIRESCGTAPADQNPPSNDQPDR